MCPTRLPQGRREEEPFSPAKIPFRHQCAKPSACADPYWHPELESWTPTREARDTLRSTSQANGTSSQKQETVEYLQHECLMNHFYIAHFAGCATLFNKDTFHSDVQVNSVSIHDTRAGQQQVVKEGQLGWVLQAVISRSSPRNGMVNPTLPWCHSMSTTHMLRSVELAKPCYLQSVL